MLDGQLEKENCTHKPCPHTTLNTLNTNVCGSLQRLNHVRSTPRGWLLQPEWRATAPRVSVASLTSQPSSLPEDPEL